MQNKLNRIDVTTKKQIAYIHIRKIKPKQNKLNRFEILYN